jgi:hypothetical protein
LRDSPTFRDQEVKDLWLIDLIQKSAETNSKFGLLERPHESLLLFCLPKSTLTLIMHLWDGHVDLRDLPIFYRPVARDTDALRLVSSSSLISMRQLGDKRLFHLIILLCHLS